MERSEPAFAEPIHTTFAPTPFDRSLFEGVPVGVYRATPEGVILDVNPYFLHMLGYPNRETLVAVNAASLYVDPQARWQWLTLLEREGAVSDFESELRRYDGTAIWVRASARAVRDVNGRTVYFEGVTLDITERKMAEEQSRQRVAQLEYALRSKQAVAKGPQPGGDVPHPSWPRAAFTAS